MSKSIKAFVALSLVTIIAACGGQQEEPQDDVIIIEEAPQGKY